jgi:Tfp pilus assembly protein PilN
MIKINLLPKGFQKRSIDFSLGKKGLYAVVAAAAIVVMLIGVTMFQKYQLSQLDENIEKAQQRAAMLEKDIKIVDALTDVKNKISLRMSAVERLDSHRSSWVKLLEDIARNVPEFVWMGKFKEKPLQVATAEPSKDAKKDASKKSATTKPAKSSEPTIRNAEIEGYAFTLNALASFMIKMMRSDYFDNVELLATNEMDIQKKKVYRFMLSCDVHYLSDDELRSKIASVNDKSMTTVTENKSLN